MHQEEKTHMRVSSKTVNMWSKVLPYAVAATSGKAKEEWQKMDTVVSIQHKNEVSSSLMAPADVMLPASISNALSVLPTSAVIPYQPLNDQIPPIEAMSRQCELNVVSKTSGGNNLHLPGLMTAQKQSIVLHVPTSIEGEGQLVRAAAYIQEHIKCHAPAGDEFVHHMPKGPPDKSWKTETEAKAQCCPSDTINEELKASEISCLTIHWDSTPCHVQLEAVLPWPGLIKRLVIGPVSLDERVLLSAGLTKTFPSSWSSLELDGLSVKSPSDRDCAVTGKQMITTCSGLSFPAAVMQTVSAPVISPFTPTALPFSQAILTPCMPETRSKVSDKTYLQFVELPSAGLIEHFDKCSDAELGPAVEQALEFSSSKEGEEWQACDAVVSIHNGKMRVTCLPRHLATFMLPVAAPAAPSVPHMHTVAHSQHLDDLMLPFEMVSRQQGPSVINRGPDVSKLCSLSLETARKWSNHTTSGEEGQLARAAAYIQERLMQCSSACDKFVPQTPKVLPEKKVELDAQ
ncbi:hypothetical protein AX14_003149 [Amanita brunnescens Koide BX004]|nr:hypothetical protein AX14_003149 [Amanita brunnescens Koide BX004]